MLLSVIHFHFISKSLSEALIKSRLASSYARRDSSFREEKNESWDLVPLPSGKKESRLSMGACGEAQS